MSNPAIPVQPAPFRHRLAHLARALANGDTARIVAIGSSTTAGEGGIPPYPGRLEAALRSRYRDQAIVVFNRGIGGQEAPDELLRFGTDVVELRPIRIRYIMEYAARSISMSPLK